MRKVIVEVGGNIHMSHSRFLEVPDDVTDDQMDEIIEEVYRDTCDHEDGSPRGFSANNDSWDKTDPYVEDCDFEDKYIDQRVTFLDGKPVFEELKK